MIITLFFRSDNSSSTLHINESTLPKRSIKFKERIDMIKFQYECHIDESQVKPIMYYLFFNDFHILIDL